MKPARALPHSSRSLGGMLARAVALAFDVVAALALLAVTVLMMVLIVARYANIPIIGVFEIISLFAIYTYMLGAVIASRRGEHLRVDWLEHHLQGSRLLVWQRLAVAVCSAVAMALFVYWSYRMLKWGFARPNFTPQFRIPMWVPQTALVIGSLGCLAYALRDIWRAVADMRVR